MRICQNRRTDAGRSRHRGGRTVAAVASFAAVASALLAGCASPGPPLPPSLKLPEGVSGLAASRVGDQVALHWTTPSRTTDSLLIAGPTVAEICRETPASAPSVVAMVGSSAASAVAQGTAGGTTGGTAGGAGKSALTAPCSPVVLRVKVTAGASQAVDALPAPLTSGPARLLAYRVQLRNAAGRTAGASQAVFAAAGPAPQAVEELHATATKAGVVLEWRPEWRPEAQGTGNREQGTEGADAIELDRTTLPPPTATATAPAPAPATATAKTTATSPATEKTKSTNANAGSGGKAVLPGAAKGPVEVRLRVDSAGTSAADAGGTIDRTAQIGDTYRYTAQRVRSVVAGGQRLELRSGPSAAVTVAMLDVFPPEAPVGLVALPGFASNPSASNPSASNPAASNPSASNPAEGQPSASNPVAGNPSAQDAVQGTAQSAGQGAAQAAEQGVEEAAPPAIDLSWEPDMEPRVVGYRVYRRALDSGAPDAWRLLDPEVVPVAAYRDLTVAAGQRYAYRVTAVSDAGYESAQSDEVVETAPER